MDELQAKRMMDAFSRERIEPYKAASGDDPVQAMCLYAWNIEVSAAFHGPLSCLEVLLRNSLHRELSAHCGSADWWRSPQIRLHPKHRERLDAAADELHSRSKPVTPGRMVAELPFGFWVSLLGKGIDYETRLWRPALRWAFPGYRGRRRSLHADLNFVRVFRNRIAHLEPIHHRHLAADHATILRLVAYISAEAEDWVRRFDRVPDVLARKADVCAKSVPPSF